MQLPLLNIKPAVFQWARTRSSYSVEKIAQKLGKSTDIVQRWEDTGEDIPFPDLEKLARLYRIQVTVFFLADAPSPIKKPKDRRNFQSADDGLTPETMLAIRRTNRYLQIARELSGDQRLKKEYSWLKEMNVKQSGSMAIEQFANITRGLFSKGFGENRQPKTTGRDFKFWRKAFEEILHIYVFQFPMPGDELDGFSYTEEGIPFGVVINKSTSENRKTFTLFHELGHILYRESGLCITSGNYMAGHMDIERKCNQFAAEFLMPSDKVKPVGSYADLSGVAKKLRVSREAYLWRLKYSYMIEQRDFEEYLERTRQDYKKYLEQQEQDKKTANELGESQEIAIPSRNISKSQRGSTFFDLVSDAYCGGKISASEAADILQIKPTKL